MASQDKLRAMFNEMNLEQKGNFIDNLKKTLEGSDDVDSVQFLDECIAHYTMEKEYMDSLEAEAAGGAEEVAVEAEVVEDIAVEAVEDAVAEAEVVEDIAVEVEAVEDAVAEAEVEAVPVDIEPEVVLEPEIELEPELEIAAELEPELELEPVLEIEVEPELVPEIEPELEPELEIAVELEPEIDLEPMPEIEVEPEPVAEIELELEPEPELEAAVEIEPELEIEPVPEMEVELEPDVEPDVEPEVELEPELEAIVEIEPEIELEPELVAEAMVEFEPASESPAAPGGAKNKVDSIAMEISGLADNIRHKMNVIDTISQLLSGAGSEIVETMSKSAQPLDSTEEYDEKVNNIEASISEFAESIRRDLKVMEAISNLLSGTES